LGSLGSKLPAPVTSENDWPIGIIHVAVVVCRLSRNGTMAAAVAGETFVPLVRFKIVVTGAFRHEVHAVEA
jgi:hypothetical protein